MKRLLPFVACIFVLLALVSCADPKPEPTCNHRDADDNFVCDQCGVDYMDEMYEVHCDKNDDFKCDDCGIVYDDGKDFTEHTHSYTVKNTDSIYLSKSADCENAATYYYSCSCGSKGTTTFVSGEAKGHSFVIENVDIKYQHTPANEYSPAIYYKSCACGKASTTETFTHGDSLEGYLTYELSLDSSYYIVSGFVGAKSNISVPNLHDGLPVFGIMANTFKDNTTIKSITMPNSIIEIGSYAFAGCTSLESIVIPTSVTNISPYTFSGCTALKTITLHSGIKTLGSFAFEKCSALKSITLNEGLETISDNAFDYCTSLESISIPDTVTTLGNMAFRHAESLRSVKFSSELKSIGNATFQYCVKLESVTLHENINTLGSSTFSYCDGLESIRILGDLTNIGTATFYECRSLTSIYFASKTSGSCGNTNYIFYNAGIEGNGITLTIAKDAVIPDGFFTPYVEDNMPKITKIVIENGNTTVNGFENYNKLPYLVSITYPASITDPAYGAFNNSLWWDNQEVGEVFISGVFYGYKCHCRLATPKSPVTENYVDSKCTESGGYDTVIYCEVCDDELKRTHIVIPKKGHSPKTAVEENRVEATCIKDGHYDSVVYCNRCNSELSRTGKTITKLGHSPKTAVEENRVEATCTKDGHYDSVIYCNRCNDEIKRTNTVIPEKGHSPKTAVEENRVEATCTEDGHYDTVVYCNRCDGEVSRTTETITKLGHSPKTAVEEKRVEATCTEDGSYDSVVYCNRCNDELKRTNTVIPKGHSPKSAVEENRIDATCTEDGHYDSVIYCSVCNDELKRTNTVIPKGHSPKSAVEENRIDATCTEDGHYDAVIYCSVCNDELSRVAKTILRAHKMSNGECSVCGLPQSSSGLEFSLNSDGKSYAVTGIGTCTSKNIVLGVYNNLSVTSIGSSAFRDCTSLTSATIPNSVTSIGDYAFGNCTSLTSVYITDIAAWCNISFGNDVANPLYYAHNLYLNGELVTELLIPDSVTRIGSHAFRGCKSLTSVIIGNSVTSIGSYAFCACTILTSVTIPNSVKSIGSSAFHGCSSLTSVTIHDSVTSIGDYAFEDCYKLVEVINLSSLNITTGSKGYGYVGYYAIEVHTGESKIVNYNDYLFYTYSGVNYLLGYVGSDTELVLPESYNGEAYEIYKYAFYECSSLTIVTIPNSVTSIGDYAFEDCYKLVEVINLSSLNITTGSKGYGYVGYYAIEVHTGESKIVNYNDYLFYTYSSVNYLLGYVGSDTELVLPESYNGEAYKIYKYAFYYCTSLTSVTIPDSVTSIGSAAFAYCTSLTSVTIPNSVTSIDRYAFGDCTSLTSVTIGNRVTSIGNSAFAYCTSLTSVTIGNGVTSIGDAAFYYCTSLTSIKYRGTQSKWSAISKGFYWNYGTGNYGITYNYAGN